MAYRWTKKRRDARDRLVTYVVFCVIAAPFTEAFRPVMQPGPAHPVWEVALGIMLIFGFCWIACDIRTLIVDDDLPI